MANWNELENPRPSVERVAPGLHFVAVPIGNARDITLRALDLLAAADLLAAEDTRSLRRLLEIHGIALRGRRIVAYHEHNGARVRPALMSELSAGKSVVYASEAGTPLISDPGFDLGRAAADAGIAVSCAPGASAVLAALNVAALPTDRFFFLGFPPGAANARRATLEQVADIPATLLFYESPRRIAALVSDAATVLGPERPVALCRELTKKFEEVRRGTLGGLAASLENEQIKGECVLVIGRGVVATPSDEETEAALRMALRTMSVRDAAECVAKAQGRNKRAVYQMALGLMKD